MSRFWPGASLAGLREGISVFYLSASDVFTDTPRRNNKTKMAGAMAGLVLKSAMRLGWNRCGAHKIHRRLVGNNTALVSRVEQPGDGLAAVLAVVEGALVDVHSDELVGLLYIQIAGELHGILQRFFAVVESVLDAVAERVAAGQDQLSSQVALDGVSTQGERQTGLVAPPLAHVDNAVQAFFAVGELALVDDESSFVLPLATR